MTEHNRHGATANLFFWLLLISFLGFVMSLGAFPSEDGPVHVYYADVLRDLFTGSHSYGHYFEVRHWLPPYALVYYLFIGLGRFVSPLAADRLVVCLYVILIACGFRYLLRVLNPRSAGMAVLVYPFIFNKFVYLGFYNFVLATAGALILCAYWLRDPSRLSGWRRIGFLMLVVLVLLAHAVPLLVAFMLISTHLLISIIAKATKLPGTWTTRTWLAVCEFKDPITSLLLAGAVSSYVFLFVSGAGKARFSTVTELLEKARKLVLLGPISPFQVWFYALPLGLLLFGLSLLLLVLTFRHRAAWSKAQLVLLFVGVLCLPLYLVLPGVFSGGAYFDQRFPIFGVLFILGALGSSTALEQRLYRNVILAATIAVSMGGLIYQVRICRRYQLAVELYQLPAVKAGAKGAIVMDENSFATPGGLAFGPYRWVGAHYFLHSKAVLLNSPFLYTGTMPIRIAPSSLSTMNPQGSEINALDMERILTSGKPIDDLDFVVFIGDFDHLPAESPFRRFCARYGFVKSSGAENVSVLERPNSG
jgi:hypothetical protein